MEELNRRPSLAGRGELVTAAGSGSFRICRLPGPCLFWLLPRHACCWDGALSTRHSSASAESADTLICCSQFELQAKGPELVKSPVLIEGSRPFFSSWRSVLRRAGGVAVKWVSLPPTHLWPRARPPPACSHALISEPQWLTHVLGVVVRTRGAAARAWCVGAQRTC